MKLIDATWKGGSAYEVLILADKTPAVLPTSGKDVDGMSDSHTFAPMSVLYVTDPEAEHKFTLPTNPANLWASKEGSEWT